MEKLLKPSCNELITSFGEKLYKENLENQIICDQEEDEEDIIATGADEETI